MITINKNFNNNHIQTLIDNLNGFTNHQTQYGVFKENDMRADGKSNVAIASQNQKGTKKIPQRDFMQMPVIYKQKDIQNVVKNSIQQHILFKKNGFYDTYNKMGIVVIGAIHDAFDTRGYGSWEANAPYTIKKKGGNSPLIDTAQLRKAIKTKTTKRR